MGNRRPANGIKQATVRQEGTVCYNSRSNKQQGFTMQCAFVIVSCLLGAASAGYAYNGPHGHASFSSGPYNHVAGAPQPVQDTYEVAAAKAQHFQAHAAARAQSVPAPHYYGAHSVALGAPQPVQDTHEVAAAKAQHFQAHAAARAQSVPAPHYYGAHSVALGAPQPVQDTHEVAAAKAEHFRAHAAARAQVAHAPAAHGYAHAAAAPVSQGYAHASAPVSHGYSTSVSHQYSHGTPVSHGYSNSVSHQYSHGTPVSHGYAHAAAPVSYGHAQAVAPVAHGFAHVGHYGGEARLVDPVAIAAGAPLPVGDTYEVAAAKAAHFKAHAAVKNGHFGSYFG